MAYQHVRQSYEARASEYSELFGTIDATAADDRKAIAEWAASVDGNALDAGCGPGHWTAFSHEHGTHIEGLDLSPSLVRLASERFPNLSFQVGNLTCLPHRDNSQGGILSWYSIIHTPPAEVPQILNEFARVLRPGGTLLIGFFNGARVEPFDHAVVTAWFWPVHEIERELQRAGFEIVKAHRRIDEGCRPHGSVLARRRKT
ncbi:class I SAM-dependent methyltransferase [Corynebacterium doosanense]|uniref:SAM-dependent methyltransferase n=1 Tax=Corynebacterium doosanense CAU 212 = DSM 45436 TaxID=558173 RepID=A0A097III8_9CORY|nr:class I SAM-dependent methyltransferase [Corynebacterium doosanense]AIT61938.1 SAM-dependent methyltransferase [Corynebacterium doosanense CAU 212 = DSM 45436]